MYRFVRRQDAPVVPPDALDDPPSVDPESGTPYSKEVVGESATDGPPEMFPTDGFEIFYPDHGSFTGFECPPAWIVRVDALYLHRGGDLRNSLSTAFQIPNFDYELGGRFTLDRRYDCLIGWELSYTGLFEWIERGQAAGAGFNTVLGAAGINMSAFNNAVLHQEAYRSRFQTAEFSEKWWGWNVITTNVGIKYVSLEEDLLFNSVNGVGEVGTFAVATNNHLIGPQIGMDLIFPIGRFTTTTKLRGSIYANMMDSTLRLNNAGVTQINNLDEKVDFASLLEFGYFVGFHVTPRVAIHAGYELSWLYGLALAPNQITNPLSVATGIETDRDGDIFFHNASVGVEVTF